MRVPRRQERWTISYRPGSRLTRRPWPVNGYRASWTGRAAGFQSGCDRDSPGLLRLLSPPPGRWVGCDHHLDSSKEEDKCLRCGGDGTTCYPVTRRL